MPLTANYISYRDSTARVILEDGIYYRFISITYKSEYDQLMQSGLYDELVNKGLLIAHEEVHIEDTDKSEHSQILYKKIKPHQIEFLSYPFEWSYQQWRSAILAYLKINSIAIKYGMILKDATPYNFYFKAGKPVMFDTSSFIFFKNGDPWIAYRQFCAEFLSPFALMHYNGDRWSLISRSHKRGLPLDFVSKQLPLKSWFNYTCFVHIHLHAKYASKNLIQDTEQSQKRKGLNEQKIQLLFSMLYNTVKKWKSKYVFNNHWVDYYENDIESSAYITHKEKIVEEWLQLLQPDTVLDLGANTGKFSLLAGRYARKVIALESDLDCIGELNHYLIEHKINNLFTSRIDLDEPTPSMGALGKEFASIFNRTNADLVLGLALTHHLFISNQFSFNQIAELFANFTNKYAIVEFIPIEDSKVKRLLIDKTIDMTFYTESNFLDSFELCFRVKSNIHLEGNERKLFLFELR